MWESLIHIWPYLLLTIPLAVAVRMSGISDNIQKAFSARPVVAIFLAALVGAFSPFCSCGVIPVIAALLISGVPLAPIMTFWLASPSMDPEIFFLTVSMLGWQLAIWRLVATLAMSLAGGFITHAVIQRKWIGSDYVRVGGSSDVKTTWELVKSSWAYFQTNLFPSSTPTAELAMSFPGTISLPVVQENTSDCCDTDSATSLNVLQADTDDCGCSTDEGAVCEVKPASKTQRLLNETWDATLMVAKFMTLAFFLEALIKLYLPEAWVTTALGADNPFAVLTAAFMGIPIYTSNLTAIPLVGGLLAQGMHPGAALAFLIAGPTTTLPAMAAVWGLVNRKVFALYVSFSLVSAVVLGYVYGVVV